MELGLAGVRLIARHRIHSLSFKKQIVQEYAAGATLNGLAREHALSRNLIRVWLAKYESGEFDPDIEAASRRPGRGRGSRASRALEGTPARAAAEPSMGYGVEPAADRRAPAARASG